MARTLGVLLAGGSGRRLGGGPKALAMLGGMTLLERAHLKLLARCSEIVMVAPRGLELPPLEKCRVIHDEGRGPLPAMVLGLEAAPYERALVLGVDFPLITVVTLTIMLSALVDHVAVVPRSGQFLQPLVAAYSPRAPGALATAIDRGERSLVAAVQLIGAHVIECDDLRTLLGPERFLNVNTPEDLAEAERLLPAEARR